MIGVGAALFASGKAPPPASQAQSAMVSPYPASDFSLDLLSGNTIFLKDFKGREPVVVNFWASWCDPCRQEAPVLAKVSKRFEGRVQFVGIITNDTADNAQAFINEFGITYENGIDKEQTGTKYGITGIPETFWIDKNGMIIAHWIGPVDEASLTDLTNKLLN